MAGLYVHIPFCRQKCHYCNFYSLATKKFRDDIALALPREIAMQKDYLNGQPLSSIYFGGGTPSLFHPGVIQSIIRAANSYLGIEPGAEITLEANPDDLSESWLKTLRQTAVNRLSIGIQSFNNADLQQLNRSHSAAQAIDAVKAAKDQGFDNLSIDLIYGIPGQDLRRWEENLKTALALHVPHISAYALTVEPGTALDLFIRQKKYPPVDDALAATHFDLLTKMLHVAGYEHYEISNFALPGKYARHNTSYWKGTPYLGTGPSAHSYNGFSRQWNVANLRQYLDGIKNSKLNFEQEHLTTVQRFNESVMTSIRTMWGVDISSVEKRFGTHYREHLLRQAQPFIRSGRIIIKHQHLMLTQEGQFFADGIAAALFADD